MIRAGDPGAADAGPSSQTCADRKNHSPSYRNTCPLLPAPPGKLRVMEWPSEHLGCPPVPTTCQQAKPGADDRPRGQAESRRPCNQRLLEILKDNPQQEREINRKAFPLTLSFLVTRTHTHTRAVLQATTVSSNRPPRGGRRGIQSSLLSTPNSESPMTVAHGPGPGSCREGPGALLLMSHVWAFWH